MSHAGYNSCERCQQKGKRVRNHTVFLKEDAPLRNNHNFKNRHDPQHHKQHELTKLELFGIDHVTQFVLDHMHCVYLGVVKRLVKRWKKSPAGYKTAQLSRQSIELLDSRIVEYTVHIPSDFNRNLSNGMHLSH